MTINKYLKEIIILLLQIIVFYILPIFIKQDETIGLITLIALSTFILSIILGTISNNKIKNIYPIIISIIFIPTIYIYYNSSALVHIIWYLIISYLGIFIGNIVKKYILT